MGQGNSRYDDVADPKRQVGFAARRGENVVRLAIQLRDCYPFLDEDMQRRVDNFRRRGGMQNIDYTHYTDDRFPQELPTRQSSYDPGYHSLRGISFR